MGGFDVTLACEIQAIIRRRKWKVRSRICHRKNSIYITGTQGFKRVLIRVSDHNPKRKRKDIDLSFHPGSPATLMDLSKLLDGQVSDGG